MQNRNHFPAILILIIIVLSVLLGLSACSSDDTPGTTDTARALFSAVADNNRDKLSALFCASSLADITFPDSDKPRYRFSDLAISEIDSSSERAHVDVSGTVTFTQSAESAASPFRWTIALQKANGDWCIANITKSADS